MVVSINTPLRERIPSRFDNNEKWIIESAWKALQRSKDITQCCQGLTAAEQSYVRLALDIIHYGNKDNNTYY